MTHWNCSTVTRHNTHTLSHGCTLDTTENCYYDNNRFKVKKVTTDGALVNPAGDFINELGRDPELANEAVVLDINVELVELMVDGLHLAHFAQPHVDVISGILQQRLHLVLRV